MNLVCVILVTWLMLYSVRALIFTRTKKLSGKRLYMMSHAIDVNNARSETTGCSNVIHLNAAGASLMPGKVYETMVGHLALENEIGGYEAAAMAKERSEKVYDEVAKMLN